MHDDATDEFCVLRICFYYETLISGKRKLCGGIKRNLLERNLQRPTLAERESGAETQPQEDLTRLLRSSLPQSQRAVERAVSFQRRRTLISNSDTIHHSLSAEEPRTGERAAQMSLVE